MTRLSSDHRISAVLRLPSSLTCAIGALPARAQAGAGPHAGAPTSSPGSPEFIFILLLLQVLLFFYYCIFQSCEIIIGESLMSCASSSNGVRSGGWNPLHGDSEASRFGHVENSPLFSHGFERFRGVLEAAFKDSIARRLSSQYYPAHSFALHGQQHSPRPFYST